MSTFIWKLHWGTMGNPFSHEVHISYHSISFQYGDLRDPFLWSYHLIKWHSKSFAQRPNKSHWWKLSASQIFIPFWGTSWGTLSECLGGRSWKELPHSSQDSFFLGSGYASPAVSFLKERLDQICKEAAEVWMVPGWKKVSVVHGNLSPETSTTRNVKGFLTTIVCFIIPLSAEGWALYTKQVE